MTGGARNGARVRARVRTEVAARAGTDVAAGARAPDFLAIAGATGAGKTALSIAVARELGGEIISMDSRQIYRGMDIGTAKVAARERALVPHHALDIRDPDQRYSAGEFGRDARRWIAAIRARGHVPVLVGGTGFFLKVLTDPMFREPPLDPARRAGLEKVLEALPREEIERWVRALDPARAEVAIAGGCQRMVRVLSVTLLTGRGLSWWHTRHPTDGKPLDGVVCLLDVPRDVLDERIRLRVEAMVADGLVAEVACLLKAGYTRDDPGMNGVGYREIADHLEGRITLEDAMERIRVATRRYAKRQGTWFRHQSGPGAVTVDGTASAEVQAAVVANAWRARCQGSGAGASASVGDPASAGAEAR